MPVMRNYLATTQGTLVASGPGAVRIWSQDPSMTYQVGDSNAGITPLEKRALVDGDASMTLETGEHLYLIGTSVVAVIAEVEAAGFIVP